MKHKQLIERIHELDVFRILRMSPDVLATLTDGFKEPLLLEVLCRATTNSQQGTIINAIRKAYAEWMSKNDMIWKISANKYPEFMDNWLMDIECGRIITRNGSVQEPIDRMFPAATTTQVLNTISSINGQSISIPNHDANDASNQRFRSLEQKVRELEANSAKANAELEQRMKDCYDENTATDEDVREIVFDDKSVEQSNTATDEDVRKLRERVKELEEEKSELKEKNEQLKQDCNDFEANWHITEGYLFDAKEKYCQLEEQIKRQQVSEVDIDEMAIELLTPLFKDKDNEKAKSFYEELNGKDDIGVADIVVAHKADFSLRLRNIDLWRILHAARKYSSTDRNFDTALRKLGFRSVL